MIGGRHDDPGKESIQPHVRQYSFPQVARMSKKRVKAFSLVMAPPNSIEESRAGLSLATDWITIVPREIPAKWVELILR
jgi:hypothetical protein